MPCEASRGTPGGRSPGVFIWGKEKGHPIAGIVSDKRRRRLAILTTLRNRCRHFWLLKVPVRRGRRPRQQKPPLLQYDGHDLHQVATFKNFLAEYGPLYATMFVEYISYLDP